MRIKGSSYFLILILAATVFVIISSLTLEAFSSKLLPIVVSASTFILGAFQLVEELKGPKATSDHCERATPEAVWRGYVTTAVWIGGFFVAICLFGFVIAIASFVFAYMKVHGTRWGTAIIYAVVTVAAIYGMFEYLMRVELYPGIVFRLLR